MAPGAPPQHKARGQGGEGGGGRGPNTPAEPVTSVIWATSPARSPAAAVHNEGGEVRPPSGCADGPCTEEADKEWGFFSAVEKLRGM